MFPFQKQISTSEELKLKYINRAETHFMRTAYQKTEREGRKKREEKSTYALSGEQSHSRLWSLIRSYLIHCQKQQLKENVTNQFLNYINKGFSFLCTVLLRLFCVLDLKVSKHSHESLHVYIKSTM